MRPLKHGDALRRAPLIITMISFRRNAKFPRELGPLYSYERVRSDDVWYIRDGQFTFVILGGLSIGVM
jgi:hypothetical protein